MQTMQTNNNKSIPLFANKHLAGQVKGDVFSKRITAQNQYLKKPRGLALACEVLDEIQRLRVRLIVITDKMSGAVWTCTPEHFARYAVPIQRGGHEPQKCLPLEYWTMTISDKHKAARVNTVQVKGGDSHETERHEYQLGLWG
jgi:hypothetical protein